MDKYLLTDRNLVKTFHTLPVTIPPWTLPIPSMKNPPASAHVPSDSRIATATAHPPRTCRGSLTRVFFILQWSCLIQGGLFASLFCVSSIRTQQPMRVAGGSGTEQEQPVPQLSGWPKGTWPPQTLSLLVLVPIVGWYKNFRKSSARTDLRSLTIDVMCTTKTIEKGQNNEDEF